MKSLVKCTAFGFALSTSFLAFAHGVEKTANGQERRIEKPAEFSLWNVLTSPAQAAARVSIDETKGYRYIKSDGLADHQTGRFPNRGNPHTIKSQDYAFRVPLAPRKNGRTTDLGHQNFGVALNGVPFDPLTAEFWNRDRRSGWNIEAMSGAMNLGLDPSNAHVQPTGAYHYHAMPTALLKRLSQQQDGPVQLGWAADGFPIYGPYGFDKDELKASYRIKSGTRPSGPRGKYDGTYVQDYEYAKDLGDLDACNATTAKTKAFPDGTYLYVITTAYPFIPRCWSGTPDRSFLMRGPGAQGAQGGQGNGLMGNRRPPPPSGLGERRGPPPGFPPPPR